MKMLRCLLSAVTALLGASGSYASDSGYVLLNYDHDAITFANWNEPQNRHWSYWNLEKLIPFGVELGRGTLPVHALGHSPRDLSSISADHDGRTVGIAEYLHLARVNGFLVLKGNDVVYEAYPRQMTRLDRHCVMSSSKSFITAILGNLVEAGVIDPKKNIGHYLPEVGPAYRNVPIQHALDMSSAVKWSEDYADPKAEGNTDFVAEAWLPGYEAWPGGTRQFVQQLKPDEKFRAGTFRYNTANASVLGWLLEKVTGMPFNRLAQKSIWEKLGAEQNALNFEDATGFGTAAGGFSMTLRDFARYAQVFANRGVAANGQRIFSEAWYQAIVSNPDATRLGQDAGRYSDFLMLNPNGAIWHPGYGGQFFYANPKTGVVIVQVAAADNESNINSAAFSLGIELAGKIDAYLAR